MIRLRTEQSGFTLVELVVSLVVLSVISVSLLGLFTSLVNSTLLIKRKAIALTLATNQMEYLKSLPYNSLAIAGGSIISSNPLPASSSQKLNGVTYTTTTSINYVDDAFDGCGSYPDNTLKQKYCRNYPPPSSASSITDANPADYKIVHITVKDNKNVKLAEVDSQISARVAETASTTGALFVTVIDENGNPVPGATVQATNSTLTPAVAVSDSSDSSGVAVFYGLPPDTNNFDYTVTASMAGYSTLSTIAPSGSLQPNYSSLKIFTQLSSFVTLTIKPQGSDSLLVETTNTSGNALPSVKVYAKGGYKKYNASTDTQYYYDNRTPSDVRPTTDASGLVGISDLVPGPYFFCGDTGATNCQIGGTTYYLAAAVPYSGTNALHPINVPVYLSASPPATTFPYGGKSYLQKVRLMLTTSSTMPRLTTLSPSEASLDGGSINNFSFQLTGTNLPCDSNPASCNTSVRLLQGSNTFTASCTGSAAGTQLNCLVDLSAAAQGDTQLSVTANGQTLTLPGSPLMGGIDVIQ